MSDTLKTLTLVILTTSALVSGAACAATTGNVGVTSNYLWRGTPQSGDESALSGGLDYVHDTGLYAGTWTSSIGGGSQYELDLYAGIAGEISRFSYDLGAIQYMYPVDDDAELDFTEVHGSVSYGPLTAFAAYTVSKEADVDDENDLYLSLAARFTLQEDLALGLLFGRHDLEDEAAEDITHYQVTLSKSLEGVGDFTFAVDKASDYVDGTTVDEDPRVSVSFSKSFDL
ncbi:MAG: TorF family putative porin [Thiohalomonadaceae bacterium]